ncbi:hypothetical protein Ancab_009639 [Ancistrocladus abbreviatus]
MPYSNITLRVGFTICIVCNTCLAQDCDCGSLCHSVGVRILGFPLPGGSSSITVIGCWQCQKLTIHGNSGLMFSLEALFIAFTAMPSCCLAFCRNDSSF